MQVSIIISFIMFSALLGGTFVATKISIGYVTPEFIAAFRIFLAAILVIPIFIGYRISLPKKLNTYLYLLASSFCGFVAPFYLISFAEQRISSSTASILMGSAPFLAIIGAHFFNENDRLNVFKALGVLVGFIGLLVSIQSKSELLVMNVNIGHLAIILAALSLVSSSILLKRCKEELTVLVVVGLTLGSACFFYAIPVFYMLRHEFAELVKLELLVALAYLGLGSTAIVQLLRVYILSKEGASFLGYSGYLVPVFGIFLSWLFLGESISVAAYLGLFIVLLGGIVSRYPTVVKIIKLNKED